MPANHPTDDFLDRFDVVATRYRRAKVLRIVCVVFVMFLAAFIVAVASDYFFEMGRSVRAATTTVLLVAAGGVLVAMAVGAMRQTTDDVVAAEVESRFPELGQAVRTSVQYGRGDNIEDASPSLLAAMQRDVGARAANLSLNETVPSDQLRRAMLLVVAALAILAIAAAASWEWRIATLRTLFGDRPYTRLAVKPGDTLVEEGDTLKMVVDVRGRVDRPTLLMTRPSSDQHAIWTTMEISGANLVRQAARHVEYQVELPDIQEALEYRVAAGRYATATHRVQVRHPLTIRKVQVEIQPPSYSRLPTTTVHEGSLRAIAGSKARIRVELDRPAESAELKLFPIRHSQNTSDDQSTAMTLAVDGHKLTGDFELTSDALYSIEGRAADGSHIRNNRYRIRIHEDRLPRIRFQEPDEEIEVHSLAEVVVRAEMTDEFGLNKAGIMIRVNNGLEYPLILQDFANDNEVVSRLTLEKRLPLELLKLTQKDSVTYYAFAEDNAPGRFRRVQTDLRFIDIRPFRRLYRAGMGGGGSAGGRQLAALEELISRERFILNRTLRLAREQAANQNIDLREVDENIILQQATAELTRELADAVAELEDSIDITEERVSDLFFAATDSMLLAMDSLAIAEYQAASLQETDAVRYLVEARDQIEVIIGQAGGGALGRFFRATQFLMRRLRGAPGDAARAAEAARKLRELADREDTVAGALDSVRSESGPSMDGPESNDRERDRLARQYRELSDQQLDIGFDVEQVNDEVQEIEGITELARSRSSASVEIAASVASAVEGRDNTRAVGQARDASALFRELAMQLEAVTSPEPAGRIAMARDMASRVAVELRKIRGELEDTIEPSRSVPKPAQADARDEPARVNTVLSRRAHWMADAAATVEDVLNSILTNFATSQADVASQIEALVTETGLSQTGERLQRFEKLFAGGEWAAAELEIDGAADRIDNLAQRLDGLHRSLVAPRIEQLRGFEMRAVALDSSLRALSNQAQVVRWHENVDALLRDVESAALNLKTAAKLREAMAQGGWNGSSRSNVEWPEGENEFLTPPEGHVTAMLHLVAEIQRYIYELAVGGVQAVDLQAAPPEYVDLVRRYMEILSYDAGDAARSTLPVSD